jgi:hypothetical protein
MNRSDDALNQPPFQGDNRRLRAVRRLKLVEDVADVPFDGTEAQA